MNPTRNIPRPLSAHEKRHLAVEATVHPTTISRYLTGAPVRSTCAARISRALVTLGRSDLVHVS